MHHYVWHEVRNGWLWYPAETQQKIRQLGWAPPRPARRPTATGSEIMLDNESGEDFLFMHREMIAAVNKVLSGVGDPGYPRVEGWTSIPEPDDPIWPTPAAYSLGDADADRYIAECKDTQYFRNTIKGWERGYRDPSTLRSLTLGELGARVEFTIHNRLHMRFSAPPPVGLRPDVDPATPDAIDPIWDDRKNDWLGDTYSSHVNPVFWKLHGWVDDCIDAWMEAQGLSGDVLWKGTWVGPVPEHPDHHSMFAKMAPGTRTADLSEAHHQDNLTKVARLVGRSGVACHFYDEVSLRPLPST